MATFEKTAVFVFSQIYLFVNCADVSLEVPRRLEAVVAHSADVVVVLVDATDVIVQIGPTLELFAASGGH